MRAVEIESKEQLDRLIESGRRWRAHFLQSIDLTAYGDALRHADVHGAVFLGCNFPPGAAQSVRSRGALVFDALPDVPVDIYRAGLYTPEELYAGLDVSYDVTLDARAYAWSRLARRHDRTLAAALHDHAIDDALDEYVAGRSIVGVMGGHDLARDSAGYRDAVLLGRALADEHLVATGGGPGAMEAANLGAYLGDGDLDRAIDILSAVPLPDDRTAWARAAFAVRREHGEGGPECDSLGVPTWYYGHEPPNAFAGHIAKYFTNSIRESVLLHVCRAGIVFLPGAAGTVQEIFQAACESYYAAVDPAPLVLVDTDGWWTRELPAWPLLETLLRDRPVAIVDSVAEAAGKLRRL